MEIIHAIQNQIKTLVVNDEVVKEQAEINKTLYSSCQNLFSRNTNISRQKVLQYLQDKSIQKLNNNQCALCQKDIARGSKTWIE